MDVIVVGGGPVGLLTAALLDAAGVRVEVFERAAGRGRPSRGSTVHPRTVEVLTMLDSGDGRRVSDVLLEQGRHAPRTHYAALPELLDYRDLDTPVPFVLRVAQWRTEEAIAEVLRVRGVPVRYDAEVTEVVPGADEVRVRAGGNWHTARYVVGADGAHSRVRSAAGIEFAGTTPDQVGFVADVRLDEPVEQTRTYWNADAGQASLVPMADAVRIFGIVAADIGLSAEQVRRRQAEPLTVEELTTTLKHICGNDFGLREVTWTSRANNGSRHATSYRSGRIFLTGDAAHVHLPAGGQGLNVGLQDAANLAWKLAAEVHGWAPEQVISGDASYDAERRPVAARLVTDTRAQDALMHTFSPAGAALRELFSGFIARRGEFARELAGSLSGLSVAYPAGPDAHPLTGTRAPDLALNQGNLFRALRPDRFLLLDFDAAFADSPRVEAHRAPRPTRPGWDGVTAALIRPDGHVAYAATGHEGLAEAIAAWTEPDRVPADA